MGTRLFPAGTDVNSFRARLQERDEQPNRQCSADPKNRVALEGLLELERKIKLVAQPAGVAHDQFARPGDVLPQLYGRFV